MPTILQTLVKDINEIVLTVQHKSVAALQARYVILSLCYSGVRSWYISP
jgi:hypothetical protein